MNDNNKKKNVSMNCNIVAVEGSGCVSVGTAWNDPCHYPAGGNGVDAVAKVYEGASIREAARAAALEFAEAAEKRGWDNSIVFIDKGIDPAAGIEKRAGASIVWGSVPADGTGPVSADPQDIRAHAARAIAEEALEAMHGGPRMQRPMNVIVTAGPTNERIDAVMKITNMSTGALGARVAETMLNADGEHWHTAEQIGKLYYISPKLAKKPVVPDGQAYKLELVQIESAEDLLREIERICKAGPVDVIVHSCAVGDYKARYSARAEDVAGEIAARVTKTAPSPTHADIVSAALDVLKSPACAANDDTKMSSYEPNLFTMMDLTPKVISRMRDLAPKALIFGFKLLENVEKQHLFDVASALRQKNRVDYVIANDLARIGNGKHPAMFVGADHIMEQDAIFAECEDKKSIADTICRLAFGRGCDLMPAPGHVDAEPDGGKKTYWHVVAANNMNTDVQIQGFASDKTAAWKLMAADFKRTATEMTPEIAVPEPEYIDMEKGFDFDDDGKRRAMISADMAQVFDGSDMWYWNLVPMDYAPIA